MIDFKAYISSARRIVVKLGSNVLAGQKDLNTDVINSVARQISSLMNHGKEVILISSGAVAAGMKKVGSVSRPTEIPEKQAMAAIGQARLIMEYDAAFSSYGVIVSQLLLTQADLRNRKRYFNARNTLNVILSKGVVPVINENDTVSVEEIAFGDNDNLSAMIALLMEADLLINLTDIDGLYTNDPRIHPDAEHIKEVRVIDDSIESIAGDIPGRLGTGGMKSKINAARKVMKAGIPMIISNGKSESVLDDIFDFNARGTFFVPSSKKIKSKKLWIAFNAAPKGSIIVDNGAREAVLEHGKSILPIGVTDVEKEFSMGDPVRVVDLDGNHIASGLVNYSSIDIRKISCRQSFEIKHILGYKPYDEIIHRDNLVILN